MISTVPWWIRFGFDVTLFVVPYWTLCSI